jgi:hypothetical protein
MPNTGNNMMFFPKSQLSGSFDAVPRTGEAIPQAPRYEPSTADRR